ncbi:hypothetical protein QAD02_003994 [Eretmocerus hayati]|uniref:Uncharacterized protein n=1 Tax=Eretmocerus hayati TaxID=131215 RepID=A0ACC2NNS8_9HYME|nr:hypothetical protein QAD02_003994 [Eretmocerus hayati]
MTEKPSTIDEQIKIQYKRIEDEIQRNQHDQDFAEHRKPYLEAKKLSLLGALQYKPGNTEDNERNFLSISKKLEELKQRKAENRHNITFTHHQIAFLEAERELYFDAYSYLRAPDVPEGFEDLERTPEEYNAVDHYSQKRIKELRKEIDKYRCDRDFYFQQIRSLEKEKYKLQELARTQPPGNSSTHRASSQKPSSTSGLNQPTSSKDSPRSPPPSSSASDSEIEEIVSFLPRSPSPIQEESIAADTSTIGQADQRIPTPTPSLRRVARLNDLIEFQERNLSTAEESWDTVD